MSRLTAHLSAIEDWVTALQFNGASLVTECHRQLDLIDAEDVARQSFRAPAAFLVMPRLRLVDRPDGGRDAECWLAIAIACRSNASAGDADALDRLIALLAAIDDQTFGQVACSTPDQIEGRPVLQSSVETKGVAVVAVTFRQLLYRVVAPPPAAMGLIGATGVGGQSAGSATEFSLAGGLTPEEQLIVDQWSGP